jgi:cytoskeleton-associated protein 5
MSPKDKTQLEERLRRVAGPSSPMKTEVPAPPAQVARLVAGVSRPGSPASGPRVGGLPRPSSPSVTGMSKLARPSSPARVVRPASPASSNIARPVSPSTASAAKNISGSSSPLGHPKTLLPSRLGRPRSNFSQTHANLTNGTIQPVAARTANDSPSLGSAVLPDDANPAETENPRTDGSDDITVTISSILSNDPTRSVDALKKIQKILAVGPEAGPSSPQYRELAEHTEGLIETITLQMAHVFDRPDDLGPDENFRLAKHLIQTLNNFCDHTFLAESLTVDILTSLLEELTLRLLETDDSQVKTVKDLSRFINMIILRLFATGRRMSIFRCAVSAEQITRSDLTCFFRALFALLLQIVKPFPSNCTLPDSKESKVAELVLKCVWKLARNIPQDLAEQRLDPIELFPAIEHFLQSVPPNEWRARATNKVPCGDMPLRTIKVIIQHVVGESLIMIRVQLFAQ